MNNILTYEEIIANPDKYVVKWQPDALPGQPLRKGKQHEFLSAKEDIVGMFGGKGSGKSDLLIADCAKHEKISNPRWHGVIFRREYKRLTEIIDRAHHWFDNMVPHFKAHWQGSPNFRFVFPSGAWLAFHNIEHLGDEEKYQGWEISDLKFDQLEEFLEPMYNYLLLQNRSGDLNLRNTCKWTANPLGVGHAWITKRYINKYERSTTNEIATVVNGKTYVQTFRWIHSTVFDNPHLSQDPIYISRLASEPDEMRRRAMFEGDPNVQVGLFFYNFDAEKQVIDPIEIPKEWELVGSLDPGWASPLSFGLQARDFEGTVYRIGTYYVPKRNPAEHAEAIREFIEKNPWTHGRMPSRIVSGHDAWARKDRYAVMANDKTMEQVFQNYGLYLSQAQTDRNNGWGALKAQFPGKYLIFKHTNEPLVEQLLSTMGDENDVNDILGKGNDSEVEDHAIDDARYGNMALYQPSQPKQSTLPNWFTEAMERHTSGNKWEVGMG